MIAYLEGFVIVRKTEVKHCNNCHPWWCTPHPCEILMAVEGIILGAKKKDFVKFTRK